MLSFKTKNFGVRQNELLLKTADWRNNQMLLYQSAWNRWLMWIFNIFSKQICFTYARKNVIVRLVIFKAASILNHL